MFIQKFFKYTLITLFLPQAWFSIHFGYFQDTSFLLNQGATFPTKPMIMRGTGMTWPFFTHGKPYPDRQAMLLRSESSSGGVTRLFEGASGTSTRGSDKKCKKLCVPSYSMYVHVIMYNVIIMYIHILYTRVVKTIAIPATNETRTLNICQISLGSYFFQGVIFRYGANFTGCGKKQAFHEGLKTEQGVPKSRPSTRAFKTELPGWTTGTFFKPTK